MIDINQESIEARPLSFSSLKEFRKSPKHYIEYLTKPFESSEAMILGQAIECLALEPEKYKKKFIVLDKPNLRTNQGKADWQIMLKEASDNKQTIIKAEDAAVAKICSDNLLNNPHSAVFIENKIKVQKKLKWHDKENNLPLIGYADFISNLDGNKYICDIKAFFNSDPDKFASFVKDRQMYLQCGMYQNAYHKLYYEFPEFVFILVETKPPYNVTVQFCDNHFTKTAKEELLGTLKAFRYCMDNKQFDMGYEFKLFGTREYFTAEVPKYYKPQFKGYNPE